MVGKVTALIVRESPLGTQLLLFQHQHAGIQIPAGTIEPGETPAAAALREATEETGLSEFASIQDLGYRDEILPANERVTSRTTLLYTRPTADHSYGLQMRAGITVRLERERSGLGQISYEEPDDDADPTYVSYRITGWAALADLATAKRRHFFLLRYQQPTAERWQVETDQHQFMLFWAPLSNLPAIRPPQDTWVALLPNED